MEIDTLPNRFKAKIIDPWIRKLKEGKTLLEAIEMSLKAAKNSMASALGLLLREDRCKRELEEKV